MRRVADGCNKTLPEGGQTNTTGDPEHSQTDTRMRKTSKKTIAADRTGAGATPREECKSIVSLTEAKEKVM
jgi:hypothetical protein